MRWETLQGHCCCFVCGECDKQVCAVSFCVRGVCLCSWCLVMCMCACACLCFRVSALVLLGLCACLERKSYLCEALPEGEVCVLS